MSHSYISDTGALPPESCIFSQFLNIGALLFGINFYIRYKQASKLLFQIVKDVEMICALNKW